MAKRSIWFGGAALQVMVIVMYIVVAADRTRGFEARALSLKVLQTVLLAAFAWLSLRRPAMAQRPPSCDHGHPAADPA